MQTTEAYVRETGQQNFVEVYDILHPLEPKVSPRDLRVSPFNARQRELGAFFLEAGGWERPHWFGANAGLLAELPTEWQPPERDAWAARFSSPIAAVEAWKTRTGVAMFDMTPLKRIEITGPGAVALLQRPRTGQHRPQARGRDVLPDAGRRRWHPLGRHRRPAGGGTVPGRCQLRYGHRLPDAGGAAVTAADPAQWVQVRDITASTCCIGLWGPLAREVIGKVCGDDLSNDGPLRYFRCVKITVGGVPVTALRVSYVGELGWELYTSAEIRGCDSGTWCGRPGRPHGIVAAGREAFNACGWRRATGPGAPT